MTLNVLVDTDVILDVLLDRGPHNGPSKEVMALLAQGRFRGHITATIVVNVFYHVRKNLGVETAFQCIRDLLGTKEVEIHPVDLAVLKNALDFPMTDFEDAVQAAVADSQGIDYIVTRNLKDYKNSKVPALSPSQLLERLNERKK